MTEWRVIRLLASLSSPLATHHSPLFKMFDQITLQIGDTAPELKLKDQHGNLVFLRDYTGRWVVLYFYPKDDTPGCTREACNFRDESERLAPFNVQVLGVSVDSRESHEKFREEVQAELSAPGRSNQENHAEPTVRWPFIGWHGA